MRPILFHLPWGAAVYAYGTMLGISFALGWWLALRLAERDGLERREMASCFAVTALAALLGARVLFLVTNPGLVRGPLDLVRPTGQGLVAYGGFLGGFLASLLWCRWRSVPFLTWADAAVAALGSGLLFTRIGCFLAGCDFGQPWDGPLAVRFPRGSLAWQEQVARGLIGRDAASSLPVHPTQLYESGAGALLLGLVLLVRRRRRPGEAFAAFTIGYAVLRFLIEVLRADPHRGSLGPFSTSQAVAVSTFVAGLALLASLRRAELRRRAPGAQTASG